MKKPQFSEDFTRFWNFFKEYRLIFSQGTAKFSASRSAGNENAAASEIFSQKSYAGNFTTVSTEGDTEKHEKTRILRNVF